MRVNYDRLVVIIVQVQTGLGRKFVWQENLKTFGNYYIVTQKPVHNQRCELIHVSAAWRLKRSFKKIFWTRKGKNLLTYLHGTLKFNLCTYLPENLLYTHLVISSLNTYYPTWKWPVGLLCSDFVLWSTHKAKAKGENYICDKIVWKRLGWYIE